MIRTFIGTNGSKASYGVFKPSPTARQGGVVEQKPVLEGTKTQTETFIPTFKPEPAVTTSANQPPVEVKQTVKDPVPPRAELTSPNNAPTTLMDLGGVESVSVSSEGADPTAVFHQAGKDFGKKLMALPPELRHAIVDNGARLSFGTTIGSESRKSALPGFLRDTPNILKAYTSSEGNSKEIADFAAATDKLAKAHKGLGGEVPDVPPLESRDSFAWKAMDSLVEQLPKGTQSNIKTKQYELAERETKTLRGMGINFDTNDVYLGRIESFAKTQEKYNSEPGIGPLPNQTQAEFERELTIAKLAASMR